MDYCTLSCLLFGVRNGRVRVGMRPRRPVRTGYISLALFGVADSGREEGVHALDLGSLDIRSEQAGGTVQRRTESVVVIGTAFMLLLLLQYTTPVRLPEVRYASHIRLWT